ncbi:MAG: hypothetical protein ACD_23C01206G0004, partial [uncultured bacterium]
MLHKKLDLALSPHPSLPPEGEGEKPRRR